MMKNNLLALILTLMSVFYFGQSIGDYRSNAPSATPLDWSSLSSWQIYNGTNWVIPTAAQGYPGQFSSSETADVTILQGDNINSLNNTVATTITVKKLIIEGQLMLWGTNANPITFYIKADAVIMNNIGTLSNNLSYDVSTIAFNGNQSALFLGYGTSYILNGVVRSNLSSTYPSVDNNFLAAPSPCNSQKYLYFETANGGYASYASCNGNGPNYSFAEINAAGGTPSSNPSITPNPICAGNSVNLQGNYLNDLLSGQSVTSWNWTATGPNGYTYNSSLQSPGAVTLTDAGTYTFILTIEFFSSTIGTYTTYKSVDVIVDPNAVGGTITSSNGNILCNSESSILTLTNSVGTIQWQSSTDNTTFTDISGENGTQLSTGALSQTTYYRAKLTSGSCPPEYSNYTITVNPTPNGCLTGSTVNTTATNAQLTFTATAGSGPFEINYTKGTDPTIIAQTNVISGVAFDIPNPGVTTTYHLVNITSADGCINSAPTCTDATVEVKEFCYKPKATGTTINTKFGVTSLGRAASNNTDTNQFPLVRKGGWIVLESKSKPFIINRLSDAEANAIPLTNKVEGMLIYNTTQKCLQIYDGTDFKCFTTQSCPD